MQTAINAVILVTHILIVQTMHAIYFLFSVIHAKKNMKTAVVKNATRSFSFLMKNRKHYEQDTITAIIFSKKDALKS
ncbi:hypothetical protein A9Q93_10075 [Nonlabens dokdonensis]|uniref:Uncharacterized protein n=1 Tax=Nonlabens dokdonensis TaxID=328515 RepID=A0A1Z8AQV7_9FLAO|nr:hypothetical protein A9Q93_10075 [Nonlabens dokdonensis]